MAVGVFWRTLGVLLRAARAGEGVNVKSAAVIVRINNLFMF